MWHVQKSEAKLTLREIARQELASITGAREIEDKIAKAFTQVAFESTFVPVLRFGAARVVVFDSSLWVRQNASELTLGEVTQQFRVRPPEDYNISTRYPGFVLAEPKNRHRKDGLKQAKTDSNFIMLPDLRDSVGIFAQSHGLSGSENALISSAGRISDYLIKNQVGIKSYSSLPDSRESLDKTFDTKHLGASAYTLRPRLTKINILESATIGLFSYGAAYATELALSKLPEVANNVSNNANAQGVLWFAFSAGGALTTVVAAHHFSTNPRSVADADRGLLGREEKVLEPALLGTKQDIKDQGLKRYVPLDAAYKALIPKEEIGHPFTSPVISYTMKSNLQPWLNSGGSLVPLTRVVIGDSDTTALAGDPPVPLIGISGMNVTMKNGEKLSWSIGVLGLHTVESVPSATQKHSDADNIEINRSPMKTFSWSGGFELIEKPSWWRYPILFNPQRM